MLAKSLKNLAKSSLYKPASYNASFIKSFLKTQSETPKPAPQKPTLDDPILDKFQENLNFDQNFSPQVNEQPLGQDFPQTTERRESTIQEQIDLELDLPYKLYGSHIKTETKTGYMGDRVFSYHKIPKDFVTNHFHKIYTGMVYSIAAQDEEFLGEYLEKYFSQRLLKSLSDLSKKGYMIKAVKDVSGLRGEPINPKIEVVDMTMVKGLSIERDDNRDETAYHKYIDIDDMGLVIYTPLEITEPGNYIDPTQNQKMYDDHAKVLMRMLVEISSPIKLVVVRPDGQEIRVDSELNSFKHVAVFESQMKPPSKFTNINKLENYMEWLGKFKFGSWKIVDLDNWMLGNPLLLNQKTRDRFTDPIFRGTKYDVESNIDLKKV